MKPDYDLKAMREIDGEIIHELNRAGLSDTRAEIVARTIWHLVSEKLQFEWERKKTFVEGRAYQKGHRDGMSNFERVTGRQV